MLTLEDFETVVKEKFIDNEVIDYPGTLNEVDTVKTFISNIRDEGIEINNLKDIPLLFYFLKYSDDEYNLKYIHNSDSNDKMQTARMTLLTMRGDCEDVHRLYNVATLNYMQKENIKLLILFFGSENEIVGGHATSLIISNNQYINLDYQFYITSNSLDGILSYVSDAYFNVYSYVILGVDQINEKISYKVEKSGFFKNRSDYIPQKINITKNVYKLRNHLYRDSEFSKFSNLLTIAGISLIALIGILK